MKMIIAVLCEQDAPAVTAALRGAGYPFTITAGEGGFYGAKKQLMFMAANDMSLSDIITTIRLNVSTREETVPEVCPCGEHSLPEKVTVGGAVVFLADMDRFIRL